MYTQSAHFKTTQVKKKKQGVTEMGLKNYIY